MLTVFDVANIIYRDCALFGVERVPDGQTLTGQLKAERCVIHVKQQQRGKYWVEGFVEVNLCVPDKAPLHTEADTPRLAELAGMAATWKDGVAGEWDGKPYYYELASMQMLADTALRCHYANLRLKFGSLNVMQ